jgi:lipoprotein-anchoring transpeptidase ErfK/SrfK
MMRKSFAAAVAVSLLFAFAPTQVSAAPSKDEAALILKKKKLAAEIKALEAKKAELTSSLTPIVKAKPKAVKVETKPAAVKTVKVITQPVAAPAVAHVQPCVSFLKCLFGNKHRAAQVQNASLVASPTTALSNNTTHEDVAWNETKYPVGSIIVRTPERALYYVSGKGEAVRYSVGVGREGMQWSGQSSIVAKAEWPSWNPPAVMIKREAAKGHMLPDHMEGGPGNPLGARAMYIGGRMYRVHGTNNEASIGGAVSSGCIRMMNADVIDLYDRVKIGAKIYVYQ